VGHSAGGHLALWLAARGRIPAASALFTADALGVPEVIALGALPDLEAVAASPDNGCGTAVIDRLIGTDRANRFTDTSIPPLLPLGVRQQLVNGREDRIIPYRFATDYSAAAEAAGDAVALHTVPATGHVELITPGTAAWTMARRLVAAALSRDSSGG
jgi:acetyl esterase/lipase